MLAQSGLSKSFWAEAINYACHLVNRLPSAAIGGKTPIEVWIRKPTEDYDYLHIFGCPAYFRVTETKLDPRAKKAVFVGFSSGVKGFRLWCPELKKLVISRDVTFDEASMLNSRKKANVGSPRENGRDVQQVELDKVVSQASKSQQPTQGPQIEEEHEEVNGEQLHVQDDDVASIVPEQQPIAVRREKRTIKKPARFEDCVAYAYPVIVAEIPSSFKEAVASPESVEWNGAMKEEMNSLMKNRTWDLVQLPKGKRAIGCKWVYAKKEDVDNNSSVRYKARLLAKGYSQKEGVDYNEIFSPVVKHCSIRVLLALVAQFDLELVQLDVKTAFLHGDLDEEIYMSQPDGFQVNEKEELVCRLHKSLYGLKQSPRQWYLRFHDFMSRQRYSRSKYDHCVYFKKLQDGSFIYLSIYVDDMLIASKNMKEIEKLKEQMKKEFEMKDLGEARKILGMEITRSREKGLVW